MEVEELEEAVRAFYAEDLRELTDINTLDHFVLWYKGELEKKKEKPTIDKEVEIVRRILSLKEGDIVYIEGVKADEKEVEFRFLCHNREWGTVSSIDLQHIFSLNVLRITRKFFNKIKIRPDYENVDAKVYNL